MMYRTKMVEREAIQWDGTAGSANELDDFGVAYRFMCAEAACVLSVGTGHL